MKMETSLVQVQAPPLAMQAVCLCGLSLLCAAICIAIFPARAKVSVASFPGTVPSTVPVVLAPGGINGERQCPTSLMVKARRIRRCRFSRESPEVLGDGYFNSNLMDEIPGSNPG